MKNMKNMWPTAALSLIGIASSLQAATESRYNKYNRADDCPPDMPAPCYSAPEPDCDMCLGPENVASNAAVRPYTCNGDWSITVAGFYWNAHEDGLVYAVSSNVPSPFVTAGSVPNLNNIIDGEYLNPHSKWNFGFKIGLGYNSVCDGWDFGILWTWFRGTASRSDDIETNENQSLIPLWSSFNASRGNTLFAQAIDSKWNLKLNLIDFELGREFWNSRKVTLRPFVGVRIAFLDQHYGLQFRGGAWSQDTSNQPSLAGFTDMKNDFKGAGLRAGLNSTWNFTSGWGLYGSLAADLVYGRFSVVADEDIRLTTGTFGSTDILESSDSFRAVRGMLDLDLGVQWATMFCNCRYGFTARLGYEQHLFFNQNQMWRVVRISGTTSNSLPNNTGENLIAQSRGDLDTQGWTLSVRFDF